MGLEVQRFVLLFSVYFGALPNRKGIMRCVDGLTSLRALRNLFLGSE